MMQYSEALRRWGAARLTGGDNWLGLTVDDFDLASVTVAFEFDEGDQCSWDDPDCHCQLAHSPTARVLIQGRLARDVQSRVGRAGVLPRGRAREVEIDSGDFDFATVLGEIVTAGGGTIGGTPHEE